jgi:hypothetical protein
MKTQAIKKALERANFWIDMIEQSELMVDDYKTTLAKEPNTKYPFLFYSEQWHTDRILKAQELSNFCINRFNQLKIKYHE